MASLSLKQIRKTCDGGAEVIKGVDLEVRDGDGELGIGCSCSASRFPISTPRFAGRRLTPMKKAPIALAIEAWS